MRSDVCNAMLILLAAKAWHDIVSYMYYKEKMRTVTKLVEKGITLISKSISADPSSPDLICDNLSTYLKNRSSHYNQS